MTRKEQMNLIEEEMASLQKATPENVVLTGKGKFRGAVGPQTRDVEISKEQILYALAATQEAIVRIYTLTATKIDI